MLVFTCNVHGSQMCQNRASQNVPQRRGYFEKVGTVPKETFSIGKQRGSQQVKNINLTVALYIINIIIRNIRF